MHTIYARGVNQALIDGIHLICTKGVAAPSRNGSVLVVPTPVVTVTGKIQERVLFAPGRKENPFFHFIESLWMLAGRNDLKPLTEIVSQMSNYSDDGGKTQPGAYGHRWRNWFGTKTKSPDQLEWAIARLQADPNDRRVVISMWDGLLDREAANAGSADVPCNTQIYLLIRDGRLEMTVTCRSNDMLWGAHGANAVHFSVLLEYLAARIGVEPGLMYQFSNNYHYYTDKTDPWAILSASEPDAYSTGEVKPYPLFDKDQKAETWDEDLQMWWKDPAKVGLRHSFFRTVATPILFSHKAFRDKKNASRFDAALEIIEQCAAEDWRLACTRWLARMKAAAEDGPSAA